MASSLKSSLRADRALSFGRPRSASPAHLRLAARRRAAAEADKPIPGTVAAYAWLAAGLVLAAGLLAFALWLAVSLSLERIAPWSAWRA